MPEHTPATIRPSRVRISFLVPLTSLMLSSCPIARPGCRGRGCGAYADGEGSQRGPAMPRSDDPAGSDLLRIDDELSEEERLVRDTVRAFAADRIMPNIADWFEAGTLPPELGPQRGTKGLG